MNRKKYICMILLTGMLLPLAAGCASRGETEKETTQAQAEETQSIRVRKLPSEYRITYELDNGDGTLLLITMARDSSGNLYYRNGETEYWFLAEGGGYIQAEPNQWGVLEEVSSGTILKEEAVREMTESFWNCAESSEKQMLPGFEEAGAAVVAERNCDRYTNTIGTENMNVTYSLYVDQETGICLGWTEKAETGIFDAEDQEGAFLCTEFVTDSVSLPSV